jgi:hypothetical protein
MKPEHPDPAIYWRHRRRMAYWSMAMLTVALIAAILGKVPPGSSELVVGVCWVFGTVLVLYFGGSTAETFSPPRGALGSDNGQQRPLP